MSERPILFSAPMVRALLAGTKTQTRRVVKPDYWRFAPKPEFNIEMATGRHVWLARQAGEPSNFRWLPCPYGQPGDRLWVRETWAQFGQGTIYRATSDYRPPGAGVWRPSIHMPRAASRITLEVTGVRVERLQAISEADAVAEGIERSGECNWRDYLDQHNDFTRAQRSYRSLWESIKGPGSWAANPWVWVVEFRKAEGG